MKVTKRCDKTGPAKHVEVKQWSSNTPFSAKKVVKAQNAIRLFCIAERDVYVCQGLQVIIHHSPCMHILQLFAKYNKNYQNVNSKRLQLTTVYFLTLNVPLALFLILTSDIMDTPILVLHRSRTD
jgi:hypothetical protein